VVELLGEGTGVARARAVVDGMMDLTGGNPLFVDQVFRLLGDRSAATMQDAKLLASLRLRHGVTEAIAQHVDVLSGDAKRLLRAGAVLGRDFDLQVAGAMIDAPPDDTAAAIHQAERSGIVRCHPPPHMHTSAPAPPREPLPQQLPPAERSRLHAAAAEVLRKLHRDQDVDDVHALAAHYVRALPAAAAE